MITVHRVAPPPSYAQFGDCASMITDDELEQALAPLGIEEVWFWYIDHGYDGSGDLLMRRGDKWDAISLSHCSCHGPLESVTFTPHTFTPHTPEALVAAYSKEAWTYVSGLAHAAGIAAAPEVSP